MRKSIFSLLVIFVCLFTFTVKADEVDLSNDERYQNIATDFRTFTVCEAIHDNLELLVAVNYGVGKNLGYPPEYLQRIRELLENITNMENHFAKQSELVIQKLIEEYKFPEEGLKRQATLNKNRQNQGINSALFRGKTNPDLIGNVVANLLAKSKSCRNHVSDIDYTD